VKDCIRPIKLDKGTARDPKAKEYQKIKVAGMERTSEEEDSSSSEDSSSKSSHSEESDDEEGSECEYLDREEQEDLDQEEGNCWDSPPESD
jgi:hypothetical protein